MKTVISLTAAAVILLIASISIAQTNIFPATGSAGIGTTTPNASSALDIVSTTKGVLVPRMTKAQRDLIASPAAGLLIYQTNSTPGFYYYSGTAWTAVSGKGPNKSLSNLNSPTAVNVDLLPGADSSVSLGGPSFRWKNLSVGGDAIINGVTVGLGSGSVAGNTALGNTALFSNTIGFENTASGDHSLYNNTEGYGNTANGSYSLFSNTTAQFNTASGDHSLYSNTGGYANTASGFYSLFWNSTGNANTATGDHSLYNNSTGYNNTACGQASLLNNTTGYSNTATGRTALRSNSTGFCNTGNGDSSLYNNTTGQFNTASGNASLYSNTTGSFNTTSGDNSLYSNTIGSFNTASGDHSLFHNISGYENTASGYLSLYANTTGAYNTATGAYSLRHNTVGSGNTASGRFSLFWNASGYNNTAFGYNAGGDFINQTGYQLTLIGNSADVSADGLFNATALGYAAKVNASNKVRIGDANVTVVESNAGSWTVSDGRFKTNVQEQVKGLAFIQLLRPVVYNFDADKFADFLMQNYPDSIKQTRKMEMKNQPASKTSAIRQSGFIAQEIAEAAKKIGYDFNGVHAPENPTDNWSLSYEKLVVPLVKAVQELSKMNDEKDAKISDLEARLTKLEAMTNAQGGISNQSINITGAFLEQNTPNPFNHSTTIRYNLPQRFQSAKIVVTNKTGAVLKEISLSPTGKGSLEIDATMLSAGAYSYSLYIDGNLIDTKQMLLAR